MHQEEIKCPHCHSANVRPANVVFNEHCHIGNKIFKRRYWNTVATSCAPPNPSFIPEIVFSAILFTTYFNLTSLSFIQATAVHAILLAIFLLYTFTFQNLPTTPLPTIILTLTISPIIHSTTYSISAFILKNLHTTPGIKYDPNIIHKTIIATCGSGLFIMMAAARTYAFFIAPLYHKHFTNEKDVINKHNDEYLTNELQWLHFCEKCHKTSLHCLIFRVINKTNKTLSININTETFSAKISPNGICSFKTPAIEKIQLSIHETNSSNSALLNIETNSHLSKISSITLSKNQKTGEIYAKTRQLETSNTGHSL